MYKYQLPHDPDTDCAYDGQYNIPRWFVASVLVELQTVVACLEERSVFKGNDV
jgi:hypothetical protein